MNAKDFIATPKLYHYTSFDSAKLIVDNKSLEFGSLPDMNDYIESKKVIGIVGIHHASEDRLTLQAVDDYIRNIGQISLTIGRGCHGFEISPMWGHYAQKNKGCWVSIIVAIIIVGLMAIFIHIFKH